MNKQDPNYLTARKMIRKCGFYSSDGKTFHKKVSRSYRLEATIKVNKGYKSVVVTGFFNGNQTTQKEFMENVDFSTMYTFCETQTF